MLGERVRAGEAVQHAGDSCCFGFRYDAASIVLRVAGVHHQRETFVSREVELGRQRFDLRATRRVLVVVIETTLTHRNGALPQLLAEQWDVARRIEGRRVVRVDAGGAEDKSRIRGRERRGSSGRVQRLTDADNGERAR